MPVMKNTILYSLCMVSSLSFSLHSQDINPQQDHEELYLVFADGNDETYPLEDIDNEYAMSDIENSENYVNDLAIDPMIKSDGTETEDVAEPVMIEISEELLPDLDENIVSEAMDSDNQLSESSELPDTLADEHQADDYRLEDDLSDLEISEPSEPEDCPINLITQDQLEEIFQDHNDQLDDNVTIPVNDQDMAIMAEDSVDANNPKLVSEEVVVAAEPEDDDIVLVPHDLINSVKKANKQKKKLEKLERKEKANFFKKSKKQQKKNAK